MTTTPLTAGDVAERLGADAKKFRMFLRAKGIEKDPESGRYVFQSKDVARLRKSFDAWLSERVAPKRITCDICGKMRNADNVHWSDDAGCSVCTTCADKLDTATPDDKPVEWGPLPEEAK
ncbi:hypothetical protein C5E44_10190 [Nocardia nova]|uniref:hypothetical protein n=1 Tax=Nocardia nova TaxID=37330 RepID=UPI000CE9ED3B|nr:hypothetical protein C5E44_10190 [Nocardia nova]